ncbi:hypothetical protein ACJMK2_001310 [Sinanodonta woodiana]|uniref:Apple domain-containing protein n=1 Tax=Sinanodonta woodiana TaxID=1069815 RepID=A0ABD3XRY4_SINWO
MSSCLVMSRTFVCHVGLFFLISASCAQDSSIYSTWVLDHDAEYNQDTSIMLWEKTGRPFIDCALFCTMDLSCKSFFYQPSLEKCLGSLSHKRGLPVSQSAQQGWNYYTRM